MSMTPEEMDAALEAGKQTGGNTAVVGAYSLTVDLNILNHLGLHLYSSMPAVLSEVIAGSPLGPYHQLLTVVRL